jgi:hypothetical protein
LAAIEAVRSFDQFTEEDGPYGEHDFGSFALDGHEFFWKIDYYDKEIKFGSDGPTDAMSTTRVLTLMLAEEY